MVNCYCDRQAGDLKEEGTVAGLLNKKAVKQLVNEQGKFVTQEFMDQLEYRVRNMINRAVTNARHFKRLKAGELM